MHIVRYGRLWVCLGLFVAGLSMASPAYAQDDARCFEQTGYCISGRLREFWEQNNGLVVFGYPISEQQEVTTEGQTRLVQWFERVRLEQIQGATPPNDIELGRLGAERLDQQGRNWYAFATSEPRNSCQYFPETQHNLCEPFLQRWRNLGIESDGQPGYSNTESLALFGLPLSDAQLETLPDGSEYTVQWFERARLEFHPLGVPPDDVQLGRIGAEVYGAFVSGDEVAAGEPAETPTAVDQGEQRIAFHSSITGDFDIYTVRPDGSGKLNLTNHSANDLYPAWSPDGSRLVFASDRDAPEAGVFDLYMMNRDGSGIMRLTNTPAARDELPAWSHDGNWIAFVSDADGDQEIYVISADGREPVQLTFNETATDTYPAWSPDDSQLVFMSDRNGSDFELYIANNDGSDVRAIPQTAANEAYPAWSPDGNRILFASGRDGNWKLYTITPQGDDLTNLTSTPSANDTRPAWSPDGSRIAFQSDRDGDIDIYVMEANGANISRITEGGGRNASPVWSPAGTQGAFQMRLLAEYPISATITRGKNTVVSK
ncbi:MAG: hypothetical protein HC876_17140 [Chloroflexaceae bacterium]|nr:hypothetical protein [Chloroflexaceae bacterium]